MSNAQMSAGGLAVGLLNLLLGLLLVIIIVTALFSLGVAQWLYLAGCLISLASMLLERANLRAVLSNISLKGGLTIHSNLSQQTGAGQFAMFTANVMAVIIWHVRFLPLIVQAYHGLRGLPASSFFQFNALLVPRWLTFPAGLLLLAIPVYLSVAADGLAWPQFLTFWILTASTLLFMATLLTVSFSKFVSGNLTHPLLNAAMTGLLLGLVSALIVAMAASQVDGSNVSFAAGMSKILNIWPMVQGIEAETLLGLPAAMQQQPTSLLYSALIVTIVAGFYLSTAKAVLGGAISGRSETDHGILANYFRERGAFDKADAHVGLMPANGKDRAVASTMLHIAKGQPQRAYEAAGRMISANNGVDKPAHRHFILCSLGALAIPDALSPAQRAARVDALLNQMVDTGGSPALVTLALTGCRATGHIDNAGAAAFFARLADKPGWAPYAALADLLLGTQDPRSPEAANVIAVARAHVADTHADLLLRATYMGPMFAAWNMSDHFIALTGEAVPQGDSFPEAVQHFISIIEAVRALPADMDTATAATLLPAVSVPMHVIQQKSGGDIVDADILGRLNDWQRQVSDDIVSMDGFNMSNFVRSMAG